MAPPSLTGAKNRGLHYLVSIRRRIVTLKVIRDPGIRELDTWSAASERLVETCQEYKNSHQNVLRMATGDEVTHEQVTFTKTKEAYGIAIDNIKKIIRADDTVRETLGCFKEDLEKVEVKRSQKAPHTQCKLLMKAEHRMQEAN